MKAVVIADDLTGALDSSVAFAQRGLRTICALTLDSLPAALARGAEVVAVSTGSRELTESCARARLDRVAKALDADPQARGALVMKKIDSRLKGHVAAEVAALRRAQQPVVLCPAIPVLGRFVRDGMLFGAGVAEPLSVAACAALPEAQVLDAESQDMLAANLAEAPDGALFVGAAGLATALAARFAGARVAPPPLPARALYAIGSRDPVTLAQIGAMPEIPAPNGALLSALPDTPAHDPELIRMVAGTEQISGAEAGARFARTIAERMRVTRPDLLLACGGETGGAILGHLGCGLVEVLGEALPGLPVSRALDGPEGLHLVTKSGGFGDAQTLQRLAALSHPPSPEARCQPEFQPDLQPAFQKDPQ